MSLSVSVVVPTYRRNELLCRCLLALNAQSLSPECYEVIVADDAADCDTERLVTALSRAYRPELRYVPVNRMHGPAAARNAGCRAARGHVIAFTDDDCMPHSDWLAQGLKALGQAAAVGGRVVVPLPPTPTDYERDCAGLNRSEFVTANCFCRRDVLKAVGGFDERFTTAWREDSDLQFTLLEHGYEIRTAPQAIVFHPVRHAPWGISMRQQRKCLFNALLYKKHPQLYRERIHPKPLRYYAITASLAGSALCLILGTKGLAFLGAGLWIMLTGNFCASRLRHTSCHPLHVAEMVLTSATIPPLSVYWHLRGLLRYRVVFH